MYVVAEMYSDVTSLSPRGGTDYRIKPRSLPLSLFFTTLIMLFAGFLLIWANACAVVEAWR